MTKFFYQFLTLKLLPLIVGAFMLNANAGIDCGRDYKCLRKAITNCDSGQIKYRLEETINNFEISGELEISTDKTGNNLCDIGISLAGIKSRFDDKTTHNYKNSKLTDIEINRIADGQRRNMQIDKDSYKKCVLKLDKINETFREINDILDFRLSSNCNEKVVVITDEVNKILNSIPELNVTGTAPAKGNLLLLDKSGTTTSNPHTGSESSAAGGKVESNAPAPINVEKKVIETKSEKNKKMLDAINAAIMGPKPSKAYEEKRKKGMTNDQIGQEAFDSFFSHLKKCDGTKCEDMKCENCSKGVLFCATNNHCMECYSGKTSDCKSGFSCMFGICKKKMTKEEFMRLK